MVAAAFSLFTMFLFLFTNTAFAKNFGLTLCREDSSFICHKVQKGESWQTLFPDEAEKEKVMRINRMNTRLYRGLIIAIPRSQTKSLLEFSPLPTQIDPPGEKLIIVSIHHLAFGAYNSDGSLVLWGPISSGKGFCPDIHRRCTTPLGHFAIQSKGGSRCVSTKFPVGRGGAPMPYCMYFHNGFALHGSPKVPGYNDSHGCIRLFTQDAKWLNREFDDGGTRVIVRQ